MRQLIYNLSIRGKILLGFFLVTAIFFVLSIFQYNSLEEVNQTNELITFAKDMNNTAAQVKYLVAKDMNVLRGFNYAKNEKELKVLMKEHSEFADRLNKLFLSTVTISTNSKVDALLRHNFRDTIQTINRLYNNEFCVSYREIYLAQLTIVSPVDARNAVKQKLLENSADALGEVDSTGNIIQSNKNKKIDLEKETKNYISDLVNEQKKHYQLITKINVEMDRILSIIESKSNGIIDKSMEQSNAVGSANIHTMIIFMLLGILVSVILAMYISSLIVKPLEKLMKYAKRLSVGELPEFEYEVYNDEVGQTAASIEQLTTGLQKTSEFAHAIGQGDFSSNYQPLSDKDVLGNSLLNMRKSLQNANIEEKKRQSEDIQRNWTTEGQALFAEILRHHPENVTELADDIMVNLVKYIKANQGGIFIYQDTDPNDVYLELLSAYAYNRKKFIKKKIYIGEGLVGACAQEKYTIYLTDIPDDYIEIESGIGSANPTALLIVPLKIENDILGVIELASFNELKTYEIELVEKIAESIAATLQTTRINTRTAELLEQSKNQTQAMKDQEEEMKQTIEEMQATQEDSMKREDDCYRELREMEAINRTLEQQTSLLDNEIDNLKKKYNVSNRLVVERENYERSLYNIISAAIITTDENGIIEYVNNLFIDLLGYKSAEVLGRNVYTILGFETKESEMAKALQAEYGNIVNTKGQEVVVKHKNGTPIQFWLTVTANIFNEKVIYTVVLNDQSKITIERDKAVGYEEEMLISKFELENKTEIFESLLMKNKIELPGLELDYVIVEFEPNKIGLNIIDSQFKKFVEHINKFYADFKRKATSKAIIQSFAELIDYSGYHFGFEDKYLNDFKYSKYDLIKQSHDNFISTLQTYRDDYAAGKNISLVKALMFIKTWMSNYKDMMSEELVSLFKSHGLS